MTGHQENFNLASNSAQAYHSRQPPSLQSNRPPSTAQFHQKYSHPPSQDPEEQELSSMQQVLKALKSENKNLQSALKAQQKSAREKEQEIEELSM